MLTKELEGLIAAAGRAEADERRRTDDAGARAERERAEHVVAEARAQSDAPTNADAIFTWLASAEGDELRAAMRHHGVARVRLGTFGIMNGERRAGPSFGSCTVYLVANAPALHVTIVMGYHGGGSRLVASAAALGAIMQDRALATLADEVREARVLGLVTSGLAAVTTSSPG